MYIAQSYDPDLPNIKAVSWPDPLDNNDRALIATEKHIFNLKKRQKKLQATLNLFSLAFNNSYHNRTNNCGIMNLSFSRRKEIIQKLNPGAKICNKQVLIRIFGITEKGAKANNKAGASLLIDKLADTQDIIKNNPSFITIVHVLRNLGTLHIRIS